MKKSQAKKFNWLTIPEFSSHSIICQYHRELEPGIEGNEKLQNLHILARGHYISDEDESSVKLYISADDYYKLYINGTFVTQGPAPGYKEHYFYNKIDILPYLKKGDNIIAVHLYYQGVINRVWNSGDNRCGLAAVLKQNNKEKNLKWKYQISDAYEGEWTGYKTQALENLDLRKWNSSWNKEGFNDCSWDDMVTADFGEEQNLLYEQPTKQLQFEKIKPKVIKKMADGYFIDAGSEVTGSLCFNVCADEGTKVYVRCAEELDESGQVRYRMRCNCIYEEYITCNGKEEEIIPYDYKAFRYARISCDKSADINNIYILCRHYPMEDTSCTLNTSDLLMDSIFQICKNAVRLGTQEGYLDCPSREKGQYLGDAVVTAHSQLWLTGNTDMLRKCISQFAFTMNFCPGMLAVAPGAIMQEIADFSLLWSQLAMLDYSFTGDKELLRDNYKTAKEIIAYFSQYENKDGLIENVSEKWNLVDWPVNLRDEYDFNIDKTQLQSTPHNVINALYIGACKVLTEMENILNIENTVNWKAKNKVFHDQFFRKDIHRYVDAPLSNHSAVHSNIYPLFFSLTPDDEKEKVADYLLERGMCCGVFVSYFYLKALASAGKYEQMYSMIVNKSEHSWFHMLEQGATTCFEAWGKEQKANTSLCHPWASGPISLFIEEIAGFIPDPEEASGYIFKPHFPKCLNSVKLNIVFRGHFYHILWDGTTAECNLVQ